MAATVTLSGSDDIMLSPAGALAHSIKKGDAAGYA